MSIINGANAVVGSAAGGYEIPNSLRFNSADSAYLSRTPSVNGNRQIWTYSGWIKKTCTTVANKDVMVFGGGAGNSTVMTQIRFHDGNGGWTFWMGSYNGSSYDFQTETSALFRDPSAWYHLVVSVDTTQATSTNRIKFYVNGILQSTTGAPTQNYNTYVNSTSYKNYIGAYAYNESPETNGYMTEINFIDGQALTPSAFGETDTTTGVWKPKEYTGSYGTNGFYLPMTQDQIVEGFNTVLWRGTGGTNRITGTGFSPDLVWIKDRSNIRNHYLYDSVRGPLKELYSNLTNAESTNTIGLSSFDADGFTLNNGDNAWNGSGNNYVGWCWDAGNSTVTNNIGTIESQVRANPTYGFSIVTASASGTSPVTVGHGLGSAPSMIIGRVRNNTANWYVYHSSIAASDYLVLNSTAAKATSSNIWDTAPTPTVFTIGNPQNGWNGGTAGSYNYVAYCFSEISGYSKFGSYSGTGATGNTITLGFKPAFVMIKNVTMSGTSWEMFDNTRDTEGTIDKELLANSSGAEGTYTLGTFSDTGFTLTVSSNGVNASGSTYIYMAFADKREAAFWRDFSGNGNNWQPNNLDFNDSMVDSPTSYGTDTGAGGEVRGNYATLNPNFIVPSTTFSNGNLQITKTGNVDIVAASTIAMSSGKWYWEVTPTTLSSGSNFGGGIVRVTSTNGSWVGGLPNGAFFGGGNPGNVYRYGTALSTSNMGAVAGDVISFALDMDAGTLTVKKNNAAVTNGTITGLDTTTAHYAFVGTYGSGEVIQVNFGQRPFSYTAPSGFKALCTTNLPEPTVADGGEYMSAKLWTGNGSTQSITGVGFQPDLVWTKDRGAAYDHTWFDAVRGATKFLRSNTGGAEETRTDSLTSFNSNGFSVGADSVRQNINRNGASYVSWTWKANGSGVLNEDGTVDSTVSANTTAGFSIVKASLSNSFSGITLGHGLGVAPTFIIGKPLIAANWYVYHSAIGNTKGLYLNDASAEITQSGLWNNTSPTSTVFSVGTASWWTGSVASDYIFYAFTPISGFSAFGSYAGSGDSNGPFVYCGFRPRFVLIKGANQAGYWMIHDTARNTYNVVDNFLRPNTADADLTGYPIMDILSNGFKPRSVYGVQNDSGYTYIYAAFAENPFKYALAR